MHSEQRLHPTDRCGLVERDSEMLDVNLFRTEKGGDPERIRESQRRRFANVGLVDEVIRLDEEWRRVSWILFLCFLLCFLTGKSSW